MVGDKVGVAKIMTIETNYFGIEVNSKQEKLTIDRKRAEPPRLWRVSVPPTAISLSKASS